MSPIVVPTPVSRRLLMLEYVSGSSTDPMIADLLKTTRKEKSFTVDFANLVTVEKILENDHQWIFLALIDDVEKLKAMVHIFKTSLKGPIKNGKLLALAVNRLNHHEIPRILKKMGFTEVISSQIKAEGLKLRIDEMFSRFLLAKGFSKPSAHAQPRDSREPREQGLVVRECRLELLAPLGIESDCWLLRRPQDVRIVNDQWIIDLVGPGPSAGRWSSTEPVTSRNREGHSVWRWEPTSKAEGLVKKGGFWVFEGRRPHFNEFHWTFTSKTPKLSYFENAEPVVDYFRVGPNRTLLIAANSETAQRKWPAIHQTILNEYRYTATADRISTPNWEVVVENNRLVPWRQLMGLESPGKPIQDSRRNLMKKIQETTARQEDLFEKVLDRDLRASLIREMTQRQCSALLWTTGQRIRFAAKVRDAEEKRKALLIEIPGGLAISELLDTLKQHDSRLFVNVSLQRGGVFFVSQEVSAYQDCLQVVVPEMLYQVQRRSHFRLSIPEEKGMYVRIGDQFHRIINLSGGGLAFATGQANSAVFTKKTELPKVSFQIYDEKIHCKAEVRWSRELPGAPEGSELTVGIQFHNLREADEQKLNLYVLEEGFEYFRQHVLSK